MTRMKVVGEGGNSIVYSDGRRAYKRLRMGVGREATARFRREAQLLMELRDLPDLRVVSAQAIQEVDGQLQIEMELFSGSLEQVLTRFRGRPRLAAQALRPVVETLAALAGRERAIIHRDIKPTNLLYDESETELWLADFGCAFIAGDARLTPDRRAIGAWAYRPPEYSNGRVDAIDEKGDVFSLGKVLWAMIYGEKGIVFPGPIWYTPDVDLGQVFPEAEGVHHAMLIIAQACAIDPRKRPTLEQLSESLFHLAASTTIQEEADVTDMLRAEALVEVAHAQQSAATSAFIRTLHADLNSIIATMHASRPEFLFWREWFLLATTKGQSADFLITKVADQGLDSHLISVSFRGRYLTARFFPAKSSLPASFRVAVGLKDDVPNSAVMVVTNDSAALQCEITNAGSLLPKQGYNASLLRTFLEIASKRVYRQ